VSRTALAEFLSTTLTHSDGLRCREPLSPNRAIANFVDDAHALRWTSCREPHAPNFAIAMLFGDGQSRIFRRTVGFVRGARSCGAGRALDEIGRSIVVA
jgi:hypothetical protein